jgi:sRNA-binding carbon storage regulator CsrA
MLALTRKNGESVVMDHPDGSRVEIVVERARGGRCVLRIAAPRDVLILRKELLDEQSTPPDRN